MHSLSPMRLLYVAESVPTRDPVLGDGSSMIPYEVLRALPDGVRVTLLTFAGAATLDEEVRRRCDSIVVLDKRPHHSALVRSVLSRHDVGAQERSTRRARAAVRALSSESDVTLMHGPHVLPLAGEVRGPLVLQTVDPWSIRLGMERDLATGWRVWYRGRKAEQALSMERGLPSGARLLTVGSNDAQLWSQSLDRPVRSIQNGVEQVARSRRRDGPPVVCFVGSLNYGPNIASAQILIEQVAPRLWESVPDARFLIAGRQPVPAVLALAGDRVDVLANVASVVKVFHSADVAVFPDETGVGVRNSVREALAAGLPVVATAAAAREQSPHPLLMVEDSVADVVARVRSLLTSDGSQTAELASGVVAERTWADVVADYLEELTAAIADYDAVDGRSR